MRRPRGGSGRRTRGAVTALVVGLAVAVALLALLVAGLLRAHAEVLRVLHHMGADMDPQSAGRGRAVPVGLRPTPARPQVSDLIDLTGSTPTGDSLSIAVTGVDHDTLLAFLTSGCTTCRTFWDAFRTEVPDVPGGARLVVVTRGAEAESPAALTALAGQVPVVMSGEAWEHYDVPYAPYFVYVSGPASKVMGEGVAAGWDQVRTLVANAVADGTTRPRSGADRERDAEVDRALARAGIHPGDPRLYPESLREPPA
ncbi:MAG TPA: hypothetical protein VNF71_12685 [Acidimicrobiales bacterium]|nr:hypothetical protein [Acidimicrobiales bacterium]